MRLAAAFLACYGCGSPALYVPAAPSVPTRGLETWVCSAVGWEAGARAGIRVTGGAIEDVEVRVMQHDGTVETYAVRCTIVP